MRCSLTAKQNSKGKRQWFIGYKAHLAADDFGVPIAYADMIERKVIIDQRASRGIAPLPMDKPEAERYKARTTVERTNSELKDGYLPDKIYRRGCHARYDIGLAILLTTLKKVRNVLLAREEARAPKSA